MHPGELVALIGADGQTDSLFEQGQLPGEERLSLSVDENAFLAQPEAGAAAEEGWANRPASGKLVYRLQTRWTSVTHSLTLVETRTGLKSRSG